ncbi:MAG: hypothetical protein CL521_00175 [Actinobacteria bacterium]|nr:hypothetical protein [Actinomycetota bacterium]
MKGTWAIFKKDLYLFLLTPSSYLSISAVFIALSTLFFNQFFLLGQSSLPSLFHLMSWFFVFIIPALSMGSWSEEKQEDTMALLFGLPLSTLSLILGKYLAQFCQVLLFILISLPIPIMLIQISDPDFGPIISGYLGIIFLALFHLAHGQFFSSLTRHPILAYCLSSITALLFMGLSHQLLQYQLPVPIAKFLFEMGLAPHFNRLVNGVISLKQCCYFIGYILGFLSLTWTSLEIQRQRP